MTAVAQHLKVLWFLIAFIPIPMMDAKMALRTIVRTPLTPPDRLHECLCLSMR